MFCNRNMDVLTTIRRKRITPGENHISLHLTIIWKRDYRRAIAWDNVSKQSVSWRTWKAQKKIIISLIEKRCILVKTAGQYLFDKVFVSNQKRRKLMFIWNRKRRTGTLLKRYSPHKIDSVFFSWFWTKKRHYSFQSGCWFEAKSKLFISSA